MEKLTRMTLEEISREIHISRTTIYKVLKNKGSVSEETRSIVNEALEKYHYVQNRNARNLAMNREYVIAYIGFQSKSANYFSTEIKQGIHRAVKEFGDDGLTMMISEFEIENPKEQEEAVDKLLKQGVTSFILAFSDCDIIKRIVEKLNKRNCLVVLLSRDFEENDKNYYVGVDYYKSGRLAAELMGKMLSEGGEVFIPVTEEYKTNQDILSRLKGFVDKIEEYPKVKILQVAYGLIEEKEISEKITACVNKEPKLKGIFDLTYRLDIIAETLHKVNRKDIKLVGFDLFDEIKEYIEDSTIAAVIYQDLRQQAYLAVKLLFEEMCYGKKKNEKKQYAKLDIIMKENL